MSGEHVCYLATTPELATICVTDGLPLDEEVRGGTDTYVTVLCILWKEVGLK